MFISGTPGMSAWPVQRSVILPSSLTSSIQSRGVKIRSKLSPVYRGSSKGCLQQRAQRVCQRRAGHFVCLCAAIETIWASIRKELDTNPTAVELENAFGPAKGKTRCTRGPVGEGMGRGGGGGGRRERRIEKFSDPPETIC